MEYGAIDLHKKESQIRILREGGEIIDRRIATTRERLTAVFWGRPRMRILLEAATESEWVAQHLETLGHEVIVADPNFTAMYGHRSRRIKTDRRDVAALADACQRGLYRAAHRRSAAQHTVQCRLNIRRELTDGRPRAIALARAIIRGAGFRMRSGATHSFRSRVTELDLPASITETLAPLQRVIEVLDEELTQADETFATHVVEDRVVSRLTTLPGIGPITASAYVAALDDATRFGGAAQVASYLGLVRREYSSGEQQTARARDPQCASVCASLTGASGVAHRRSEGPAYGRAPHVGRCDCATAWKEDCHGRLGATPSADALCHVARRSRV
jgi:transposase